ncbi:MAG: hypothetical protein HFH60_10310 [Lachnospiraceae bacterium]|jgi:predicted nucleic acid-binding Zn ribbon protein|nr:hypothetical protein [Lachnospiraceae bacterium]
MKTINRDRICPICGKPFEAGLEHRKYCSDECRILGRRTAQKRYHTKNSSDPAYKARKIANTRRWQLSHKEIWNEYQIQYNNKKNK